MVTVLTLTDVDQSVLLSEKGLDGKLLRFSASLKSCFSFQSGGKLGWNSERGIVG